MKGGWQTFGRWATGHITSAKLGIMVITVQNYQFEHADIVKGWINPELQMHYHVAKFSLSQTLSHCSVWGKLCYILYYITVHFPKERLSLSIFNMDIIRHRAEDIKWTKRLAAIILTLVSYMTKYIAYSESLNIFYAFISWYWYSQDCDKAVRWLQHARHFKWRWNIFPLDPPYRGFYRFISVNIANLWATKCHLMCQCQWGTAGLHMADTREKRKRDCKYLTGSI